MQQFERRLRIGYGIFLSALTAAVAVMLIAEAADIYYAHGAYTREIVGQKLLAVIGPAVLWLAAAVVGFVLSVRFPMQKEKPKADRRLALRRLRGKIPQGTGEEFLHAQEVYRRGEGIRFALWGVASAFSAASAVATIVYLSDIAHFPAQDVTGDVLALLRLLLPLTAVAFALFSLAAVYEICTERRDLSRVKELLVLGKGSPAKERNAMLTRAETALTSAPVLLAVRCGVLVLGVTLFAIGIANGGAGDVLTKAINICTECIGLG